MPRSRRPGRGHRKPKRRILIVGEGKETEPNYFRGFRQRQSVQDRFKVEVRRGKGGTPLDAVQKAIELKEHARRDGREFQYDDVWCVVDVEQVGQNPQLGDARKLARQNDVHVALSNPAFEVWILAHFERTAKSFLNCDKVIEQIRKHWQREFQREYVKNDSQIYRHLGNKTADAVENAKWVREIHFQDRPDIVECNSATEVYRLVDFLLQSPG